MSDFDPTDIQAKLTRLKESQRDAGVRGLRVAAEHVLKVANKRVPFEHGDLEKSGKVTVDPDRLRSAVSYNGPEAVTQHENPNYQHAQGRQSKFLESALYGERREIRKIVAAEIRRGTDSGEQ